MSGRTVAFLTLGCKVNQYDSQAMRARFEAAGYTSVPWGQPADVLVVNTCTVTGVSDQKSRKALLRACREQPWAALVAAGCMTQRMGEDVLGLPGVILALGNQHRMRVVELLETALAQGQPVNAVGPLQSTDYEPLAVRLHEGHARAVIKIQEGCDQFCSYCIVPYVRGMPVSRPLADVLAEARALAERGYAEVVLTGVLISSYDGAGGAYPLAALLEELEHVEGIRRVRLGSLEPGLMELGFVERIAKLGKLCRHFHLSLQSGSATVLQRMNRRYTPERYAQVVFGIRQAMPDAAFTTDLIAGFPGETEQEHEQSRDFVRAMGFSRIHVFGYSPRAETPAANMPQVPSPIKQARVRELLALGGQMERGFAQAQLGSILEALAEEDLPGHPGIMTGWTRQYQRAAVRARQPGQIVSGRAARFEDGLLWLDEHIEGG